jgi:hypothetical protein
MVIKVLIIAIGLLLIGLTIGIVQDHNNSLSVRFQDCHQTSDNSGFIGMQCPGGQYFIPSSERDELKGLLWQKN